MPSYNVDPIISRRVLKDYTDIVELMVFYRLSEDLAKKSEKILEERGRAVAFINTMIGSVIDVAHDEEEYGLAVDIGTTKIVVALIDMLSGKIIDVDSEFNKQMIYGEDIVSRISYALRDEGLKELQRLAVETINTIVERICKTFN